MADPSHPAPQGPSRGLRIAFALSVALNLAVAGIVGGALLRRDEGGERRGVPRDLGFGQFSRALTPEDRAELRRRFVRQAPGLFHDRRAMRSDLEALLGALRADPFQPDVLKAAMDAQANRMTDRLHLGQSLVQEFLLDLAPEDRRAFADRLEAAVSRRGPAAAPGG